MYPDNDTPLGFSGNISEADYDIDEDMWAVITQNHGPMTVDSSLGTETESNNHMDVDTAEVSLMLDGSEASVAGFGSQGDGNHQMVCYGMVSKYV